MMEEVEMPVGPVWASASQFESSQLEIVGWWREADCAHGSGLTARLMSPNTGQVFLTTEGIKRAVEVLHDVEADDGHVDHAFFWTFTDESSTLVKRIDKGKFYDWRADSSLGWRRLTLIQYTPDEVEALRVNDGMFDNFDFERGIPTGESGYVSIWNEFEPAGESCIRARDVIDVLLWWHTELLQVESREDPLTAQEAVSLSAMLGLEKERKWFPEPRVKDHKFEWNPNWQPGIRAI